MHASKTICSKPNKQIKNSLIFGLNFQSKLGVGCIDFTWRTSFWFRWCISPLYKLWSDKFQANWLWLYPWLESTNCEMSCSLCKIYGPSLFTSRCYKTSTLSRLAESVLQTAMKKKCEADSVKNAMVKVIKVAQLVWEDKRLNSLIENKVFDFFFSFFKLSKGKAEDLEESTRQLK